MVYIEKLCCKKAGPERCYQAGSSNNDWRITLEWNVFAVFGHNDEGRVKEEKQV